MNSQFVPKKVEMDHVLHRLNEDSKCKRDFLTEVKNLQAREDGKVVFLDENAVGGEHTALAKQGLEFDMTDWAYSQLLSRLGMPVSYFRKVMSFEPEFFSRHFNFWTRAKDIGDKTVRLRTKIHGNSALIRGAVSDVYSTLDNYQVGEIMAKLLEGEEADYEINSFYLDDKRFHMRLTYPELTRITRTLPDGTPDASRLGNDIVNSEVGAASFMLAALVWREICSNGLMGWGRDWVFTQRHVHLRPVEFQARVAETMVKSLNAGTDLLIEYEKTQAQKIVNPFVAIRNLAKEGGFSQKFADTVKEQYEGDDTAYGVINAFTRAARELPNEERLETERFAGRLIKVNPDRWLRLQEDRSLDDEVLEVEAVV